MRVKVVSLIITAFLGVSAQAEVLSELAYFTRCYTQLTGHRPALSHPWRAQIKAGTLTGYNACVQLLDKARFGAGHMISNTSDKEAVDVLNHMNDFHRSWFASDNLENAVMDTNGALRRDKWVHDETEPALHVTRALFEPNVPFSEVVTQTSAMDAIRSSGTLYEKTWDGTSGWMDTRNVLTPYARPTATPAYFAYYPAKFEKLTAFDASSRSAMNPPLVETGDLYGVQLMTSNAAKSALKTYSVSNTPVSAHPGWGWRTFNYEINVHESAGAGLVGAKTYLALNLGRPNGTYTDGGLEMPRRWAKAVLSETLCRDLPAIRDTDATNFVQGNSKLPFRNSRQCMQCHASIDPLGAVARNISIRPSPTFDYGQWTSLLQVAIHPVELKQVPTTDMDEEYYRRPPEGTLFYRSYNGDRVSIPITGVSSARDAFNQLGTAIANSNDFYVCVASRYYQKFTGIKVNLQDPGDKASLTLNLNDLRLRNEVISLGQSFKQHKNARTLILDILKTKTYKQAAPAGDGQ